MSRMEGLGELIYLYQAAADVVGVLVIPVSCGVMWCGKKVVEISQRTDLENHPVGRTCLKVMGYAIMTLGFLAGTAGSILLTAASSGTLGVLGYGGWAPVVFPLGLTIGICVAGIGLGVGSAYIIGRMFHRSLCELNQKCDQNAVIPANI